MPSIIRAIKPGRRTPPTSNASSTTSLEIPHALSEAMNFTTRSMKRLSSSRSSSSADVHHHSKHHGDCRHSMGGVNSAVSTPKTSLDHILGSALLELEIETPPMVCYGPPAESTGALMSGILYLNVILDELNVEKLEMTFRQVITYKKPVQTDCPDCSRQVTNLQTWKFVEEVSMAKHGEHCYPFSYHFPGNLPATTNNPLTSVSYELIACVTTTNGEKIKLRRDIHISRSILEEDDRHSIRIFPPTSLTANLTLPQVVHHGGDFPVEMRLEGITTKDNKNARWKVRKMSWKIDEVCKTVSPACKLHSEKLGGEGKGILHEDSRTIAGAEVKGGWKTDFDYQDKGKVEALFMAGIPAHIPASNDVQYAEGNIQVSHTLVIEMIVAEETVQKKVAAPTGAARVLRMNFSLVVTDHSGLGISWVEECPPLYSDVPKSPPSYAHEEAHYFDLPPSFESLEEASQI